MTKVHIRCPTCSKSSFIEVSDDDIKNATRGLFAVNIPKGIICEHSFIAYVDKNFAVRDAFMADFQIELPDVISEDIISEKEELTDLFDLDLIKLNLTASLLGYVLRAMIYKKKIVIISDQTYMANQILNFFNYITQNSFDIDLVIVSKEEYNENSYSEHFAFQGREIIRDYNNNIQSKKLNVEKTIIQKFLNEYDPMTSLILLKNEIQKVYELSITIMNVIQNRKKNEEIYSKKLINEIQKKHNVKVVTTYLDFLCEIVENYFEIEIPKSSAISDFLGTL